MNILQLIKRVAVLLNITEVLKDDSITDNMTTQEQAALLDNNQTFARLLEFCKLTIQDVQARATTNQQVTVTSENKMINISSLDRVANIISVRNKYGEYVKYELLNNNICLEKDGEYMITFNQVIDFSNLNNEIVFNNMFSDDTYVYGVSAYYCLSAGMLPEFNVYHAQYIDRLSEIKRPKIFAMPCRCWHE